MVAIKGIKALGVTLFAGVVGSFSYNAVGGSVNPLSPLAYGAGAAIAGRAADWALSKIERRIYNWAGWD